MLLPHNPEDKEIALADMSWLSDPDRTNVSDGTNIQLSQGMERCFIRSKRDQMSFNDIYLNLRNALILHDTLQKSWL